MRLYQANNCYEETVELKKYVGQIKTADKHMAIRIKFHCNWNWYHKNINNNKFCVESIVIFKTKKHIV